MKHNKNYREISTSAFEQGYDKYFNQGKPHLGRPQANAEVFDLKTKQVHAGTKSNPLNFFDDSVESMNNGALTTHEIQELPHDDQGRTLEHPSEYVISKCCNRRIHERSIYKCNVCFKPICSDHLCEGGICRFCNMKKIAKIIGTGIGKTIRVTAEITAAAIVLIFTALGAILAGIFNNKKS